MEAAKNMLMKDMGHAVVQPKEQIPRTETSAEIKAAAIRTMADCSSHPPEAASRAAKAKPSPAVHQAIRQAKENIERREQEKQREAELTERKNQKRQNSQPLAAVKEVHMMFKEPFSKPIDAMVRVQVFSKMGKIKKRSPILHA